MIKKRTSLLFAVMCLMTGCSFGCSADEPAEMRIVTGDEAREIHASSNKAVLLDVRTQEEFDNQSIPGSILIPYDELETRLSELPDKNAEIIIFCRAGRRSAISAEILANNGYKKVYDMQIIGYWWE
ncbi:MAG: rhodanese-like domain-containing protein [Oscillospiraceae bacterium]|nr:rhodanese-like domain-containing protein [Oscillospiraceae bacterium]